MKILVREGLIGTGVGTTGEDMTSALRVTRELESRYEVEGDESDPSL